MSEEAKLNERRFAKRVGQLEELADSLGNLIYSGVTQANKYMYIELANRMSILAKGLGELIEEKVK